MEKAEMRVIAHIRSDLPRKFGIPRQSGLVPELEATVVFEPEFRDPEALRGLEGFSHIWLLWQFSESVGRDWSPTVRPPRLGGNARLGVFATRSPFRPNPIGLSAVKLEGVEKDPGLGLVLRVSGADLMDGTPIYDIKPYLPYADCIPGALGGFAPAAPAKRVQVEIPAALLERVPAGKREALAGLLAQDPRPPYQQDPARVYTLSFAGLEISFRVDGEILTVSDISPTPGKTEQG